MLINWHFLPILSSILLVQNVYSFPLRFTQQPESNPRMEENAVDLHLFAQHYSTHLSFDHLDLAYSQFSKKLSNHFQELVQVTDEPVDLNDSVDLELLKGQLKGAVSSYVEDSLPSIWNARASDIDKNSLSNYIESVCRDICFTSTLDVNTLLDIKTMTEETRVRGMHGHVNPSQHAHKSRVTVSNTCLQDNSNRILSLIDDHVEKHLRYIVHAIITNDLPPLFDTTQLHVRGILDHFERLLTANNNKTTIKGPQFTLSDMNTESLGTSEEISNYLINSANLNHGLNNSVNPIHSIRKFTLSATIH